MDIARTKLDATQTQVICSKENCNCELATIIECIGGPPNQERIRFIFFDLVWQLTAAANRRLKQGYNATLRRMKPLVARLSVISGLTRCQAVRGVWNYPEAVLCYKCGTIQLLDPEVLRVVPLFTGIHDMLHVVYVNPPAPPGPPGELYKLAPDIWSGENVPVPTPPEYDPEEIADWKRRDREYHQQELEHGIITLITEPDWVHRCLTCGGRVHIEPEGQYICGCLACVQPLESKRLQGLEVRSQNRKSYL